MLVRLSLTVFIVETGLLASEPSAFAEQLPNVLRKRAFLVGVSKYHKDGLEDLKYGAKDAENLATVLEFLGFEVKLLIGDQATQVAIRKEFVDFMKIAQEQTRKQDLVLVFFSGHGVQQQVTEATGKKAEAPFFCACDSRIDQPASMIPINWVMEELKKSSCSNNLLLVDACRSNPARGGVRSLDGSTVRELPAKLSVLFSSGPNQRAYESAQADVKQGVFTHVLLQGLRGEAATEDGEIIWLDLVAYVSRNVPKEVVKLAGNGLEQRPNYFGNQVSTIVLGKTSRAEKNDSASTGSPRPTGNVGQRWGTPKGQPPSVLLKDGFTAAELESVSQAWADHLQVRVNDRTKSGNHQLCLVPPGVFKMGASQVHISKPFFVGVYEVNRYQFKEFVEAAGYRTDAEYDGRGGTTVVNGRDLQQRPDITWKNPGFEQGPTHPVVQVSWNDAVAYCQWLTVVSQLRGELPPDWGFRLLTEAEWEYACRAGYAGSFSFGDDPEELITHGNVADLSYDRVITGPAHKSLKGSDGFVFTAPIGKYQANRFGLHDMHGNVSEWCSDRCSIAKISNANESERNEVDSPRVLRGGSWDSDASECTSNFHDCVEPSYRDAAIGFRIALTPIK